MRPFSIVPTAVFLFFAALPARSATWTATGSLASARYAFASVVLSDGKVLSIDGNFGGTAERYDPAAGTWSSAGTLAVEAGQLFTATRLADGKVLVAGDTAATQLYDPSGGTWTATGSMAAARSQHGAVLLSNGKVLVAGGVVSGNTPVATAELYDPGAGTWSATGSMATARRLLSLTLLSNGKVLAAGGFDGSSNGLASAELYDPGAGTWSATGAMVAQHGGAGAVALPSGDVLVVGGYGIGGTGVATCEIYSVSNNTWSSAASLATARWLNPAVKLPSGQVVTSGGIFGASTPLASTEVYDPTLDVWTTTGAMTQALYYHSLSLLSDGRVLAAGGFNGSAGVKTAQLLSLATSSCGGAGGFSASASPAAGDVSVTVPPGAFGQNVCMTLQTPSSLPSAASPTVSLVGTGVGLQIDLDASLQPKMETTLTVSYRDSDIVGLDESKLVIARYDATSNVWVPLVSTVDAARNQVTARTGHFSLFQIMAATTGDVSSVKIFPNPLRPALGHTSMTFAGLPAEARVRIYTLSGDKVRDLTTNASGMASWDGANASGARAASGVYFALIESGSVKKTVKIAVQR